MPKQTSNKKVVSSKSSKKISTPLGILIVIGVGLLLAVVGTFGYSKYKESNLQAKAAGYTALPSFYNSGIKIAACKKPTSSSWHYDITVIATKDASTKMTKKLRGFPSDQSSNPVYAVYFPKEVNPPAKYVKFQRMWTRDTVHYYSKTQTPWWGGVVNVRTYPAVHKEDQIAAQGASDLGGLRLYDEGEYYIATDKILAPNIDDYWSTNGDPTKQGPYWLSVLSAWEKRTTNIESLANCS